MDGFLKEPDGANRAAIGRKGQAAGVKLAAESQPDLARDDIPQPDRLLVPILALALAQEPRGRPTLAVTRLWPSGVIGDK
jgi:hypothetical protein